MSQSSRGSSRRQFMTRSGVAIGGGLFTLALPAITRLAEEAHAAHLAGDSFKTLTAAEALEIEAFAAQIVPTDDGPGAREAGVVYFIDRALGDERHELAAMIREGLADLESRASSLSGVEQQFSALSPDDQIQLMRSIEETEFFDALRFLTMAGMFSHPMYGGNRDRLGWKLIGFDDRHFWQPPFGYYDANYVDPYRNAK